MFVDQVLELLRGLSLDPTTDADRAAKSAAATALDAAADEAVAPLKQQHATALTNATATARNQALMSALTKRISFAPGKPPLTAVTAAAVIDIAAEELKAAMAASGAIDAGSNNGSNGSNGLVARRLAADQIVGAISVIDSTTAALTAVLGEDLEEEDEQSGEKKGIAAGLTQLYDSAAVVQESAMKVLELKLNKTTPAAAAADGEGQEPAEEDKAAAAVAAVEEALQAAVAAMAAVVAADSTMDAGVTKEDVKSEIAKEVEEAVEAAVEKTKSQQETALQV